MASSDLARVTVTVLVRSVSHREILRDRGDECGCRECAGDDRPPARMAQAHRVARQRRRARVRAVVR